MNLSTREHHHPDLAPAYCPECGEGIWSPEPVCESCGNCIHSTILNGVCADCGDPQDLDFDGEDR